jgi:hypothetical protein
MALRRADHSSRGVQPSAVCLKSLIVKIRTGRGRGWPGVWSKRRTERQKWTDSDRGQNSGRIFLVLKNSLLAFHITSNLYLNNAENYTKINILKSESNNKFPENLPGSVKQNCTKFGANVSRIRGNVTDMNQRPRGVHGCAHENLNTDPIIVIIIITVIYITPTQIPTLYADSFPPNTLSPLSTPL